MFIAATCATILAALASAQGGETISLTGNCGFLRIAKVYAKPVTIDASKASVSTLHITGANIAWRGGVLTARDGINGAGIYGFAAFVTGPGVSFEDVTFTNARYGILAQKADGLRVHKSRFTGIRADGIQVQLTKGFKVTYSIFEKSRPLPRYCTLADGSVIFNIPQNQCKGVFTDGDHADAVQMRNGVSDVWLDHNIVTGNTQGLSQMAHPTDIPLSQVRISYNRVAVDQPNAITLQRCKGCRIDNNVVLRTPAMPYRAIIVPGDAVRCANQVPDEKAQDGPCLSGR